METNSKNPLVENRRSKLLVIIFLAAIVISIVISFFKFFILRDYTFQSEVACDPATEMCFIWECTPTVEGIEGDCTGNPEEDTRYYKIIRKNAATVPRCNSSSPDCDPLVCGKNDRECEYITCIAENEEGIACSHLEEYVQENDFMEASNSLPQEVQP